MKDIRPWKQSSQSKKEKTSLVWVLEQYAAIIIPKLTIQIHKLFEKKGKIKEAKVPDWEEKQVPNCIFHSHISQEATNPKLHKQNHHQWFQSQPCHQWQQSLAKLHLLLHSLCCQKWRWSMSSAATSKYPEAEYENSFPESAKVTIFIEVQASKGNEEAMEWRFHCGATCYTDIENVKKTENLITLIFFAAKGCLTQKFCAKTVYALQRFGFLYESWPSQSIGLKRSVCRMA